MTRTALIVLILLQSVTAFAEIKDCDPTVVLRDETQESLNKLFDPNYYNERSLSLDNFCGVISKIKALYPKSEINDVPIQYIADWDSPDINANTLYSKNSKNYVVRVFGGLAMKKTLNEAGLAAVVCHEVGHVMGGVTGNRIAIDKGEVVNITEGFADYFVTHQCLKRYFKNNTFKIEEPSISRISEQCLKANDYHECVFVLNAAYNDQSSLNKGNYNFNEHDLTNVETTKYGMGNYPSPQCRFDTMVAGYQCPTEKIPCGFDSKGTFKGRGMKEAFPPRCFFSP